MSLTEQMPEPAGVQRPKREVSAETRAKMSAARKQAFADPAVRAKMSAASKARWADPNKGPHHLRGLTPAQRDAYKFFRGKEFTMAEALAMVRAAKSR